MLVVDFQTESRFPVDRDKIREIIEKTLISEGILGDADVGVTIVGDRKMRELNKKYLGHDYTTDVLSFPLESGGPLSKRSTIDAPSGFISPPDGVLHLGDIVVSYPQAVVQAGERNVMVDEEVTALIEHGVLHLLGIHHEE